MTRETASRESGFTFVELMFATVIIVAATLVLISHLAMSYRATREQRDRVFAFMTAKSILDEVQALSESASGTTGVDLNTLDDGATANPTLSIANVGGVLVAPNHPISGNLQRSGQWLWSRQITVAPLPGIDNRTLRYVTVRVLKRAASSYAEVASVASVVHSTALGNPTTQVFDVYLIAIENVPGWWVHMESIRPFIEAVVTELERNNPGMEIRSHWVTKASYGRNQAYRPYINESLDSNQDIPEAYFYPGLMPTGSASIHYYVPSLIKGRYAHETGERNGYDSNLNPYPYALADYFNHGMRHPRELELHQARVAAVQQRKADIAAAIAAAILPPPPLTDMSEEPTYRLLLEDMCTSPDKYRHALILNLHGELLPMPSIRNYSDAAKDPAGLPNVRVVTHPEELRTQRPPSAGVTDVRLRTYAWVTNPDTYAGSMAMPTARPIAIQVFDLDLTDGAGGLSPGVQVQNLRGGPSVGGTTNYFPMATAKVSTDPSLVTNEMYYDVQFVDPGPGLRKYTLFRLHHTPVRAPRVNDRGVHNNSRARLYNLEYQPACAEAALDFSQDLYNDTNRNKNTARWVITIPGQVFADARWVDFVSPPNYYDPNTTSDPDRVLTIRTRIWDPGLPDPLTSGSWPAGASNLVIQPDNLSETYTWWAGSADAVPITERSQFLGDPRYNPYKDLWNGSVDFPDGYNWFFDSLNNSSQNAAGDYPGIDGARTANLWMGRLRQDLPRFMRLLRTALVKTESVFSTLVGWSYYYVGFGNDIGYDAVNGYPSSIPVNLRPLGTPGSTGFLNTIGTGRRLVRGTGSPYWWCMPWLGELYPDSVHGTQWLALDIYGKVRGNLLAGNAASQYYQAAEQSVYASSNNLAYGTAFTTGVQRTASEGCTTIFNIGSSASTFHHQSSAGTGTLVGPGIDMATKYSLALPTTTTINRPFGINLSGSGGVGPEWDFAPYVSERHTASILRTYYTAAAGLVGSGLVQLVSPDATLAGHMVPTGLAQSASVGTSLLAKYSLLSTLQSYFECGDTANPYRIPMPPRVMIQDPSEISDLPDPATISVLFDVEWRRWDGALYSETMAPTFTEDESVLRYVLLYSKDNGGNWSYMEDDAPAVPGLYPANPFYAVTDAGLGQESYSWDTPSGTFPAGTYLIRVEAYRTGQQVHYSFDQSRIFIRR